MHSTQRRQAELIFAMALFCRIPSQIVARRLGHTRCNSALYAKHGSIATCIEIKSRRTSFPQKDTLADEAVAEKI
jgi:hypothetical protein